MSIDSLPRSCCHVRTFNEDPAVISRELIQCGDNIEDEKIFAFDTDDGDLADINAKDGEIFAVNMDGGLEELALGLD